LRIFGIPHYLWYAHTYKSVFLILNHFFVNGIITSTKGSCPIKSKKVFPVGQAINFDNFERSDKSIIAIRDLVHIGRFDQSKNISEIIDTVKNVKNSQKLVLTFTQIGSPTTKVAHSYYALVNEKFVQEIKEGWIKLKPSIFRSEVPSILREYDAFLHAYNGSLDKSIVEATFVGIPVLTTNPEYLAIFVSWARQPQDSVTLDNELQAILNMQMIDITKELEKRRIIAIQGHSLNNWALQISKILTKD
jgi:glycosyltransferase involved in cell wall biosynthesis